MKALIQHLIKNNMAEILAKSFLNCHSKGIHSIMLLDCPEKLIRIFFTDKDHDLYKNHRSYFGDGTPLSIAIHPHNTDITLHCIKGEIYNEIYNECSEPTTGSYPFDLFHYQSQISDGQMGFIKCPEKRYGLIKDIDRSKHLKFNDYAHMDGTSLHTVYVPKGMESAWFVYEGKSNSEYESFAWSNADLENIDTTGLYQKPTKEQIISLLNSI